jgi:hypothetical protein
LSKNGDFSPFYRQNMATFAHLFPKKTLCTLLVCTFKKIKIHHGAKFVHLKIKHWGGSVGVFYFILF